MLGEIEHLKLLHSCHRRGKKMKVILHIFLPSAEPKVYESTFLVFGGVTLLLSLIPLKCDFP